MIAEYIYKANDEFIETPYGVSASLELSPTMEEVIRCRDCKWFRANASPNDPDGRYDFCTQHGFDFKGSMGFCAWAERRD